MLENIINGVYVELDCIMDTRLSLMYDIDKNVTERYLTSGMYHKRYMDQFDYLTAKVFRTIYKRRNGNVLDNPTPTEIINILKDYCHESLVSSKSFNDGSPIDIYLNIHPYDLTEESIELIRMGLSNSMLSEVNIEILNLPPDEVSVSFMNENIGLAIMYDGLSWIEYMINNGSLTKMNLPDVTLLTPMLIHRKLLIKENELNKFFKDIEKNLAMLINVLFIPTKYFSLTKKEDTNTRT